MSRPRHNKTQAFVDQRLFDSVTSFAELEDRVSRLPTPNERGDAFEVFAEAYLATTRMVQAREVWPFDAIPLPVKQQLSLDTGIDMGVDGVLRSTVGEYSAYQVKFRSRRPTLTWDNLSTFMGLTDQVGQRVLFTNCDELPSLMNERSNFFCIRGSDLDRLTSDEFDKIAHWLRVEPSAAKKKHPLPHQDEALANILPALESHDRATAVMACGTGKTLIALWVAERLKSSKVLILVPSLALLRQTLHEWLKESSANELIYMCVCSDPTVDSQLDSVNVQQSDLDFPVTTDREAVERFLLTPFAGVKMLFSTYQSAHVVAEAMRNEDVFDFGIFDEAHKTAGRIGVRFGFAVTDDNLPIKKRLFLTATPRHFDFQHKDKEGEAKAVYSMDVPEVYGPQCHTLSFAEAARRDIICPYKVVISVVTSQMVNNERLRRGEVIINGDAVRARHVANQIAVQKAIEKYDVTKVFTFHRSIKAAQRFTSPETEGIATHLSGFDCFHVNGRIPSALRDNLMRSFAESPKAIVSNARCLTEGVDLPAVDMVAFLSPKRSWVDIVQATGRAMRKSPAKDVGYVLVPLFVEQQNEESVDDALARTKFQDIWDVLAAMLEQDDAFVETIRKMREERGRTGGFDDGLFRELIEVIGDEVSLDTIRRFVTVVSVDRFGASWDERFGELVAYKEEYGHLRISQYVGEYKSLARWVMTQRSWHKRGQLSEGRVRRLESIGFQWSGVVYAEIWEQRYEELKAFWEEHGHCNVSGQYGSEHKSLGRWVMTQRRSRMKGRISRKRVQLLEAINFQWTEQSKTVTEAESWDERYEELKAFWGEHGHFKVSRENPETETLGNWVIFQRQQRRKGELSDERIMRLDEIGFDWRPSGNRKDIWNTRIQQMKEYKERFGDCNVPANWNENRKLGIWVVNARAQKKKCTLSQERVETLDELGFDWELRQRGVRRLDPDEMYRQLVDHKNAHGHVRRTREMTDQLVSWTRRMKVAKAAGQLGDEWTRRLDALGFDWRTAQDIWDEMFIALVRYKQIHGDCNVPTNWEEDQKLSYWASKQRTHCRGGGIKPENRRRLEEIGFEWETPKAEETWEDMYAELIAFKKEHGHCEVPRRSSSNPKLAKWVNVQRDSRKQARLDSARLRRLDDIGFIWDVFAKRWEAMFAELEKYKDQFGDCDVPTQWPDNPELGRWIVTRRTVWREIQEGKRSPRQSTLDQFARLEGIGFIFTTTWNDNLSRLREYKEHNGDCNVPTNWPKNKALASWVSSQRALRRSGDLSEERLLLLNELGFVWKLHEWKWEQSFMELSAFKDARGDCDVPMNWPENPRLASWVSTQRSVRTSGTLSEYRIERLDELGFVWKAKQRWFAPAVAEKESLLRVTRLHGLQFELQVVRRELAKSYKSGDDSRRQELKDRSEVLANEVKKALLKALGGEEDPVGESSQEV